MLIPDHPYVSEFFKNTAAELQIPVLKNEMAAGMKIEKRLNLLEEAEFIEFVKEKGECALYSNFENSIDWISESFAQYY